MSDQEEALLDEDLGDEEYDLGVDEEDALLADNYENDRQCSSKSSPYEQNSYKGEEETDDVLDLGVTDALDDSEGEDENIEYRNDTDNHNHNEFYEELSTINDGGYYEREKHEELRNEGYEDGAIPSTNVAQNSLNSGDLREKLQKNVQRKVFVGNGQGLEDDDCDDAEERRNRFQNERIMISPKMNHEIPDSLENVVTVEQIRQQSSFRGRGRGRGMRGIGPGRFVAPNPQGNYMPRFNNMRVQLNYNDPKPFRPPLLDGRPAMYPRGPPNNMMNPQQQHQQQQHQQQQQQLQQLQQQQQIIYQQLNLQYQAYMQNVPPQSGGPRFPEPRPSFNPNQFPGPQGMSQVPQRVIVDPRHDYRPRGLTGPTMQRFHNPTVAPAYMQNQQSHYQTTMGPRNQGPSLLVNPGLSIPGNQGQPMMHGNPRVPVISVNQGPPMRENLGNVMMQNFTRMPGPNQGQPGLNQGPPVLNQGPPRPNQGPPRSNQPPIMNQPTFDHVTNFQEPQGRAVYDSRPHYNQPQPPAVGPMNNSATVSVPSQAVPCVANVPLTAGHKILINPHFRGAVQPTGDARLAWDSQQQQQPPPQHQPSPQQRPQHQHPNLIDGFSQQPAPYQNQNVYGQPAAPAPPTPEEKSQIYQPVKSDDPYAYFSDVWQENKVQKPQITNKSYSPENSYTRDSSYGSYGNKYGKSESTWSHRDSYQEEQRSSSQSYRERDPPSRLRSENLPRRAPASNSSYHNDSYDDKPSFRQQTVSSRSTARPPAKRSPEIHERAPRPHSPKRVKIMSNRQEFRSTTVNEYTSPKKEEDVDPEMREYRKKMEEQKRLREQILQEKENRRKQAAMKNTDVETRDSGPAERALQRDAKPVSVVTGITKDNNVHPLPQRGRGRPLNAQPTEGPERTPGVRIVRAMQTVDSAKNPVANQPPKEAPTSVAKVQTNERGRTTIGGQTGTRRVVIHKSLPNTQKIATTVQKAVSNLQRPQTSPRIIQNSTVNKGILKKSPIADGQKIVVNANRTIVKDSTESLLTNAKDGVKTNVPKIIVNTQNNQRVVLQQNTTMTKQRANEQKSNTVRIDNLAVSTSETQIRRMCQGIGTLESIRMGEGNATIVFKTQSAALVFHKKYQRKMLDLSMINVHLVKPASGI